MHVNVLLHSLYVVNQQRKLLSQGYMISNAVIELRSSAGATQFNEFAKGDPSPDETGKEDSAEAHTKMRR